MYCSLRDALIEYIQYHQTIKSLRLTVKRLIDLNLVETRSQAEQIYVKLKNKKPLEEIVRKLIFWKYDKLNPVYEDYKYTFMRIFESDKKKRWEEFKSIYPL